MTSKRLNLPAVDSTLKSKRVNKATDAQQAIATCWHADRDRGIRTPSEDVAAEAKVTSSYVRRLYRQFDGNPALALTVGKPA